MEVAVDQREWMVEGEGVEVEWSAHVVYEPLADHKKDRKEYWQAIIDSIRKYKGSEWILICWYYQKEHLQEAGIL